MQSQAPSRKRPAPGASPLVQQQPTPPQPAYSYQQIPENADFTNFDFSQPYNPDQSQTFTDPIFTPNNDFSYLQNSSQPPTFGSNPAAPAPPSTDLVRRPRSQHLAVPGGGQQQEQWNGAGFGGMSGLNENEYEQDLDRKVQLAKRDAQGKRKQIPPFVQKLSSFLDSSHTDLIRWSDDGRSFIVLDEDEFARTLIPELFKHNNYASFVRQLNMYGFHKTVNITDGSLRQSEKARKGVKPPSMYSHPYFRKNRPDLLWLIQKPSTKSGAKRKREGGVKDDYGSDDERQFSPGPAGAPIGELPAPSGSGQEMASMPRNELTSVRHELQKLQNQQRFISKMITQLKEQNDAFYRQASTFQSLHDRHENSINAILTFLATFYNRSLETHGGAQNLVNLFGSSAQNQETQQDRVVEEFNDAAPDNNAQVQRYPKKPQLLLGPGPVANYQQLMAHQQRGQAITQPNSARTSLSPPNDEVKRDSSFSAAPEGIARPQKRSTASPVVKTDEPTPGVINQVPESDQMMSLINSVNATNANTPSTAAPAFDFSSALDHYQTANGNSPLTPQQREDMLALMAANQHPQPLNANGGRADNALISPQPPQMPDFEQLKQTQQQLEMLTDLQKQQDEKVQELNRRLQPLSPTGAIPGLHGQSGEENPFDLTGAPGDYDPNAFINFDDSSWQNPSGEGEHGDGSGGDDLAFDFGNGPIGEGAGEVNWDFTNDSGGDMFDTADTAGAPGIDGQDRMPEAEGGGRIESVSSAATSPEGQAPGEGNRPDTPRKRARKA
ncbi:hypothetical protein B0A50_02084 [Salinomyces thailandicus]|uniref:HSF-type DNA-binding domain-containing protein n=1 Tax=Salinomyces thailandicus TaxID=706561 RepID=A0A4U0UA14_9PEZI|nr:hypothetical protein B0A50_02084 [Salinomyces thailandica]